jgi:seryl-tRNA synthetase
MAAVAVPPAPETTPLPTPQSDPASIGNAAILNRLNEIESNNQALMEANERLRSEADKKDEQIKALSAEKRKEMEQMIDTAIDTWLNSLTGVSEEMRGQFRKGISKITKVLCLCLKVTST